MKASAALLQVAAAPTQKPASPHRAMLQGKERGELCAPAQMEVHLEESRSCIPKDLQEMHLQAIRLHAAFLAGLSRKVNAGPSAKQGPVGGGLENLPDPAPSPSSSDGPGLEN